MFESIEGGGAGCRAGRVGCGRLPGHTARRSSPGTTPATGTRAWACTPPPTSTTAVDNLLGAQASPENPSQVNVAQPSVALTAQAAAAGAFDTLFLGLGAVALLVGAVGVANIMVISVLERRQEIGLRRALGATRGQIRVQFLAEAILLSLAGGVAGVAVGAVATAVYARAHSEAIVIPPDAWASFDSGRMPSRSQSGQGSRFRRCRYPPRQSRPRRQWPHVLPASMVRVCLPIWPVPALLHLADLPLDLVTEI